MGYTCRVKLAQAFHEAGHACMALILGRPAEQVSVMFNRKPRPVPWPRRSRLCCRPGNTQFEAEIMIGLAGPLAEARSRQPGSEPSREPILADPDRLFAEVGDLVALLPGKSRDRSAYFDQMMERAQTALSQPGCWEAVAAVAWALVYRLQLSPLELEGIFWHTVSVNQKLELRT